MVEKYFKSFFSIINLFCLYKSRKLCTVKKEPVIHDMQQSNLNQAASLTLHAWCEGVHSIVGVLRAKATWSMTAHTCNPSTLEAEAGGSL